ncbi:retrovirus-related pol polyprotein from transposon TNT 1-94 [Tanacetum coccineum]
MKVEESLNMTFDESPPPTKLSPLVDDDVGEEEAIKKNTKVVNNNNKEDESIEVDETVNIKESKNHPLDQVIGNLNQRILRSQSQNHSNFFCFISTIEPKNVNEALKDESWVEAMQEELNQFVANDVWELIPLPITPKAWYNRLKAFLIKHEYSMGMVDNTLVTKKSKSHLIIVQIYVDDIIFSSTSQNLCDDFAKIMQDEIEMSMMGELNFFLGLQIKQMEDGIFFNQSKYIKEMLKKFRLEDSKPTKTPMSMEIKLTKDDEADSVDNFKYRGMIGSLLYLTASKPDIMFSILLCARFQENPKTTYLEAVKHIFRYIRRTSHLGLWYPKGTRIETIVYAESDHAGDYVDRKSTSGVCTFMGCCLTSWFAKKQTALAISTTEAEYISAEKACQQALWMKQALIDYGIRLDDISIMTLKSRYVHEGRTFDISFYNDLSDDSVAKFTAIGFDCLLALDEQIYPRNLKENMVEHPLDEQYKLVPWKMSSLKAKQPKKPPPKRTRNVEKSKRTQLITSSSTESPPSHDEELPSTKLSLKYYSRALKDDPNMSKEQI